MAGSTGVLLPPKGYLQRLRQICDKHGILLIFDEVITGFGRTGSAFAAQTFGVTPDMITCAKGLTNAAVPMGAVIVQARRSTTPSCRARRTPSSCTTATPTPGTRWPRRRPSPRWTCSRQEGLFERAAELAPYWEQGVHALRGLPHVIDIRNIGLIAGIELEPMPGKPTARARSRRSCAPTRKAC